MQHVITAADARKITKGRTPLVPVEYEEACRALEACRTLDEAKYWDNKADALAAWAKIHHDQKIGREAKALKLHAYRRMGELAAELRPTKNGNGRLPGARALLIESGLSALEANAARMLARAPKSETDRIAALARPPSPSTVAQGRAGFTTTPFKATANLSFAVHPKWRFTWNGILCAANAMKNVSAVELGRSVKTDKTRYIRETITGISEWLDAFEQALPKEKRK